MNSSRTDLVHICLTLAEIFMYCGDIGSDIWVAAGYRTEGNQWWFRLTVAFILGPALLLAVFSSFQYLADRRKVSVCECVTRVFVTVLLLAPLYRYMTGIDL